MFFDILDIAPIKGTMTERSKVFCKNAKNDNNWVSSAIIQYLHQLKERVERKEITAGTMKNRYQSFKLFREMTDIPPISWKKISRGIHRVRKYANARASTPEEISKILEYLDRRIKALVPTMASSGIRVGVWDYIKWKHITSIQKNGQIIAVKLIVATLLVIFGNDNNRWYKRNSYREDQ